jgi:FkbM family methyltransferase
MAVLTLARWTPYLESEMLGLSALVGPGSVCIDVGSAAGLYTLVLSNLVGSSGEVHSVEPLSFAHTRWVKILASRSGKNVRHHSLALGSEPGSADMSVPIGRFGPVTGRSFLAWKSSGLGSNTEFAGQMAVTVKVDTLDALAERANLERLDLIKVDVEGAELHVLQGGEKTIEKFKPAILLEIEDRHIERFKYAVQDITVWLKSRGYRMYTWQNEWQATDVVRDDVRNYLFRATG